MKASMFKEIILLDNECFGRGGNFRSIDNLAELMANNPDGCFVVLHKDEIADYTFTRILGSAGFIGPLGVKPVLQGKDLGRAIVQASVDTLIRADCTSIGLEVLPSKISNIGLYQKTGFIPGFSTMT